ncbi:MAG: C39 family peptidase [Candidatus Levybacteria bacterium]|nr:C39 family peptidase [Candidatus Levybacteria bacterium]
MNKIKTYFVFLVIFFPIFIASGEVFAQTPTPTDVTPTPDDSQAVGGLTNKIHDLESKISDLQSQEKSLSSQISVMDNQIKLTEYKIDYTKGQISQLTDDISTASEKITNLEGSLTTITKTLLERISAGYQLSTIQPLQLLLSSQSFSDFITRTNYIRIVQEHDKKLMYNTVQAKNDYSNQKQIFEDKKQQVLALQTQLENYTKQLDQDKEVKQRLLNETQGSEANYQRLLAQARAQLAGFSRFAESQGGASLLGNQTSCDDWGCYYNQRDSSWGSQAMGSYTLASDGCLVTSVAMVYTHYGHRSVTPATINANDSNFASYERGWLNKTVTADGATLTRQTVYFTQGNSESEKISGVDGSTFPVIVGISYDSGPIPDHFIVITGGSNGNYTMNDPFTPNGKGISFSSKYSISSIRNVDRISI